MYESCGYFLTFTIVIDFVWTANSIPSDTATPQGNRERVMIWKYRCIVVSLKKRKVDEMTSARLKSSGDLFTLILLTAYPKKYAHGFCFAVLCCGYTLTDFPIPIRLTSLALWQSNDCPSASKATLMNLDKYFMWIHYERLHKHNKAKHNKTVCIFLGIYCTYVRKMHFY